MRERSRGHIVRRAGALALVWVVIAAGIRTLRNQGYQHWTPLLVASSAVFAVALVLLLRKPISANSNRAWERTLRRQREKGTAPVIPASAFPTPALPIKSLKPLAAASKENARG